MPHTCRTIVITGGIVSGIGKGITAASLGRLLIDRGFKVNVVKADPYLNQDAGTMNPFRHGEVFVTDDGAETDLDLGHYERFMDVNLTQRSNFTGGSVYRSVMDQEREGNYLGRDIQVIPHITNEIKRRIELAQEDKPDFLIVEVGGTVGDIEALPFLEGVRQYYVEHRETTIFIHVVKMDYLYPSDEGKTKPIQHSIISLRSYGMQPDLLVVRCKRPLASEEKEKIALFGGVPNEHIIPAEDAKSLYDIPSMLEKNGISEAVLRSFGLDPKMEVSNPWQKMQDNLVKRKRTVRVGLVGKYIENSDAYLSVLEAIRHAGIYHQAFTEIIPINSEDEAFIEKEIPTLDAMIIPGGFGSRGIEGKIRAIQIAREKKVPFLGICLGLQTAVIEFARHVASLPNATSTEFKEDSSEPVIAILPDQLKIKKKGGTMRLGQYPAVLQTGSLAEHIYQTYRPEEIKEHVIMERHRHRYEVNPDYHQKLRAAGLGISGMSPQGELVEFIELPKAVHPYFIATQAHPEFRSRPHRPHPLFAGLIEAALAGL